MDPVPKAQPFMIRCTTEINDQTAYDETDNEHDLEGCKDNFGLAVEFRSAKIGDNNEEEEDGNPDSRVDGCVPELNERRCGADLGGHVDCHCVPYSSQNIAMVICIWDVTYRSSSPWQHQVQAQQTWSHDERNLQSMA